MKYCRNTDGRKKNKFFDKVLENSPFSEIKIKQQNPGSTEQDIDIRYLNSMSCTVFRTCLSIWLRPLATPLSEKPYLSHIIFQGEKPIMSHTFYFFLNTIYKPYIFLGKKLIFTFLQFTFMSKPYLSHMLRSKKEQLKPHLFFGQKPNYKPWLVYGTWR